MSTACGVRVTGPLAMYADGFRADLAAQGYAVEPANWNLRTMAHVSRWMDGQGLPAGQLSIAQLEEFLEARRREGYRHALSIRAVMPLIGYLRRAGVGGLRLEVTAGSSALDLMAGEYRRYLVTERALTADVARKYTRLAREFLSACEQPDGLELTGLPAAAVTDYVVAQCRGRRPGSAKFLVTALRSLLGYLFLARHTRHQLAFAVPAVAHWGAGSLPRALNPQAVAALLASCDATTLAGRRPGDPGPAGPAGPAGGRGGRPGARRPGLAGRGDLSSWQGEPPRAAPATRGRRGGPGRLPARRPSPRSVPHDVPPPQRADHGPDRLGRDDGGLPGLHAGGLPRAGAHRLRHSAASAMLAGGGTLTEVGQVLRHAQLQTTAIYAKIDRAALRGLARPWPGGAA